jgi:hypothetical protein
MCSPSPAPLYCCRYCCHVGSPPPSSSWPWSWSLRLFVGRNMCLSQHALEARGHMRRRPRAYEAIPAAARDWFGGFTSEIAVVLSMLQDVDGHAHLLPPAPTYSHLRPPTPARSHWPAPASTPKAPRAPNPGISPSSRSQKSSAHAPPQTAPRALLVLAAACICLCLCRFLAAAAAAAALLPCLASCNATRAPPRRLDLPAAAMTPVWLPCPDPTLPNLT